MSLARRIRTEMERLRYTQEELALRSGISQGMVYKLVSGKTKETSKIVDIAIALNTTAEYLMKGKVKFERHRAHSAEKDSNHICIAKLAATGSMGAGINQNQLDHDEQVGYFETTKKWVRTRLSHASAINNIRIITGLGDSMSGTFNHGDALFVDTGISEISIDAVYALSYDGELFIKRVQRVPGGNFNLISDNRTANYDTIVVNREDASHFSVIGRVIGALNYNEI